MSFQRAVLLAGLLVSCLSQAAPLRLVTGEEYAPYVGRELPGGGMLTEVVLAALTQVDRQPSLAWQPWKRGYQATLKGSYDATFPYLQSTERETDFLYSEPLYKVSQRIFTRHGQMIEPDRLDNFSGKRLCYPLGWLTPPILKPLLDSNRLSRHEPADLTTCAKLIAMDRDDLFIADILLGQQAIRLSGIKATQFEISQGELSSYSLHLIVPRQHPHAAQLIAEFNRGLHKLMASGEYQRIVDTHRRHNSSGD
ncbi:MAG: substrate-binding periplasmic protein [Pseudomonas sp.]